MSRRLRIVGCAGVVGAFLIVSAGASQSVAVGMAPVSNLRVGGPHLTGQALEYSTNWAGYSATSSTAGTFTSVTASWVQPALSCTSSPRTSYAAFWTGLDGANDSTVEQTGTLGECAGGVASYVPWYELYPQEAIVTIPVSADTVHAGDTITATVTATGSGNFTLFLSDSPVSGSPWSYTENATATTRPLPLQESAEVIAEAPSSGNQILPLASFGTVTFKSATVNSTPLGSSSGLEQIDMDSSSGALEASASGLTVPGGTTFTVTEPTPPSTPTPPTTPSPPPPPKYRHF